MGTAKSDELLKSHAAGRARCGSINFAHDYAHESKLDRTCQNKMTIDHRHVRQEMHRANVEHRKTEWETRTAGVVQSEY